MEGEDIKIFVILLHVLIIAIVFYCSFYILNYDFKIKKALKKRSGGKYDKLEQVLKKRGKGYFGFDRINIFLKQNGNPLSLSPAGFIISKFLVAFILFIMGSGRIETAILFSILGFFLLDILYVYSNKKDMKKINFQLVDVYDFLNIQISAGVFVGYALTEAYLIVRNKRLKRHLAELCAEINLTKDIEKALDNFMLNFKSVEIESFVLAVKQSLRTGMLQQALEDLSNSQKETNLILIEEETDRIKLSKDLIQVMIYLGIMAIVFFGLAMELSKGWMQVF